MPYNFCKLRNNTVSKRKFCSGDDDDEDGPGIPIDPGQLMSAMFQKPEDIKTDGNKIYFYKDITRETVLKLNTTLSEMSKKLIHTGLVLNFNKPVPIYLFINSSGGDCFAGLSAMDHISTLPVPVYTVIDGICASAATFLSVSGEKRFIMKHSTVLIHQLRNWFAGTYEEMKDDMKNTDNIMDIMKKIYKEKTTLPVSKLKELLSREIYLTADEAIKYNIADDFYDVSNGFSNAVNNNKRRKRIIE